MLLDGASVHAVMTSHVSVLQVLSGVPGIRALFDHIMAPGVRQVEVKRWKTAYQQDTLPHTALCHTCPNAQVAYTMDAWGQPARRVDQ